jgi:enoyl-CoA hydratase
VSKVELESDGDIRVLTLNNPERRNAIDEELRDELAQAATRLRSDVKARALVVTGAGSSFCAGADLPALFGDPDRPVAEIRVGLKTVYDSFLQILQLPFPTIAAVHGPAVGAGLNLAMACDVRIAGPAATFAAAFTKIGLHPGGGCTWFLMRALGRERALALLLEGGSLDGAQAVEAGLALQVADDPLNVAMSTAARYAELDPQLARDIKSTVNLADERGFTAALEFESWAQASTATGPAIQQAVARYRR